MLLNSQVHHLACLVNLEFWVKFKQSMFISSNLLKFSPARILHYRVYVHMILL